MAKESIAFRLENDVMEKLESLASREGVSRSHAARKLIEAGLNSLGDEDVKTDSARLDNLAEILKEERSSVLRELTEMRSRMERVIEEQHEMSSETIEGLATIQEELKSIQRERAAEVSEVRLEPVSDYSMDAARQIAVPPKGKADDSERRGPDRPMLDSWVVEKDSKRATAHYVSSDSPGGVLYFACGRDDSATMYRIAKTAAKICPKCESKVG